MKGVTAGAGPVLGAAALMPAVVSAVQAEWRLIHGEQEAAPNLDAGTGIGSEDLPADSLALLRLASAVGAQFGLAEQGIDDYLLRRRTLGEWSELAAHALGRREASVRFITSGSTGEPRTFTHTLAALWQETHWLADALPRFERVYTVAPPHHIYGFLLGVLLPAATDRPVVHAAGIDRWRVDQIRTGDLVVGFPTFWGHLAGLSRQLPAGTTGVSSTAPLPAAFAAAVTSEASGPMIEIFGASETAGLGIRERSEEAFRLMDHWRRDGVSGLQRRAPDGRWLAHDGPDDSLAWVDERHFRPEGRRDGAIQVGGINVYPGDVARRIGAHPAVASCAVRSGDGPQDRLKAFVVPRDDISEAELRETLRQWFSRNLAPPERPTQLTFGTALPRNPMGKLQDW